MPDNFLKKSRSRKQTLFAFIFKNLCCFRLPAENTTILGLQINNPRQAGRDFH
jgi:hypothetical protein